MLKRGLVLVLSLAFVSSAFAGATVELVATDLGGILDVDGNVAAPCYFENQCNFSAFAPDHQFEGGETILVQVMVTPSQSFLLRGAQVDYRASSPELQLGMDVNTVNQGIDSIPNFWFDYSTITGFHPTFGRFGIGTYPATGNPSDFTFGNSAANHNDFSNLLAGDPGQEVPFPPAVSYNGTSIAETEQLHFDVGVATRLGGMLVTLPDTPGEYTLDLLNPPAGETPDVNNGIVLDFGFGAAVEGCPECPTEDPVIKWASAPQGPRGDPNPDLLITYGAGGPLTLTVIPEPATLVLLGLGGIAALRRRRS